jgi:ubiquitin-activating enzyme E1
MVEINETAPLKIVSTGKFHFEVELDSTGFTDYIRQGVVENQKVATNIEFLSWTDCFKNPVKCSTFGMLEVPDLAKFGRSEQLHASLWGIHQFLGANGRYPATADVDKCKELATEFMKTNGEDGMTVEIEDDVFKQAIQFSECSVSPLAAFFGGIVAQEIVK